MGAAASVDISAAIAESSADDLRECMIGLSASDRQRIATSICSRDSETALRMEETSAEELISLPSEPSLIAEDSVFGARAPHASLAEALIPQSLKFECQTENPVFMLGPSHLDANLCRMHGIIPKFEDERGRHFNRFRIPDSTFSTLEPDWDTPVDVMGYAGLPVHNGFTLEILKRAYSIYGGRVVWMVPDFRFNNFNLPDLKQKKAANSKGDSLFLPTSFGPANISSSFLTEENDRYLLEYALECIDHVVKTMPNVRLLFWCAFFRTYDNAATTQGIYKDLYDVLVQRYSHNILDINAYISREDRKATKAGAKFWLDRSGHPSRDGYQLIHRMAVAVLNFPHVPTPKKQRVSEGKDGLKHTYSIVGTWSQMKVELMVEHANGDYTFDFIMGANSWEMFHILQDSSTSKKICPVRDRASQHQPCNGPHDARTTSWLVDARQRCDLDSSNDGGPGDTYRVKFSWGQVKQVEWSKISSATKRYVDHGTYYVVGSWQCFQPVQLTPLPTSPGTFSLDVQMTKLELEFGLIRNKDARQFIYPECEQGSKGSKGSRVLGVGASAEDVASDRKNNGQDARWRIAGNLGDVFKLLFHRNPKDLSRLSVSWEFLENRPIVDVVDRYFVCGDMNNWERPGDVLEMRYDESEGGFVVDIRITFLPMEFYVLENNLSDMVIQPDKKQCTQVRSHNVVGPGTEIFSRKQERLAWVVDKGEDGAVKLGDTLRIKFAAAPNKRVSWHNLSLPQPVAV